SWVRIGELVNQCILASTPTPTSPRERMRALGRGLEELGRASVSDLRELLQRRFWAQKSRYLDHLCGILERYGRAPKPWAEDVAAHIDSCAEALTRPDYVVPREFLLSEGDAERGLMRTRSFIGQLGRLFNEWPALVEAADHLREKGVTLAAPVDPGRS
ncbi:MAG: hypothetical protein KC486_35830, partial [Myxococcales bacterium]|nr:hypothetical protein [Myxococcales bacterium]